MSETRCLFLSASGLVSALLMAKTQPDQLGATPLGRAITAPDLQNGLFFFGSAREWGFPAVPGRGQWTDENLLEIVAGPRLPETFDGDLIWMLQTEVRTGHCTAAEAASTLRTYYRALTYAEAEGRVQYRALTEEVSFTGLITFLEAHNMPVTVRPADDADYNGPAIAAMLAANNLPLVAVY